MRIVQALILCGAMALLLTVLVLGGEERAQRAGAELVPFQPGGPAGVLFLERRGDRLIGTRAVWGLAPGTRHHNALRGPGGRCAAQITQRLPLLVADENGVAFGRIDAPVPRGAFAEGLALTVHAGPEPDSSAVACGTLTAQGTGGRRLTAAQLTQLGGRDTGAPGTDVSALVQLRRGRPIGAANGAPLEIRARRGDRVALALRADEPDELRIEGYGLAVQVGPGTTARLAFRADRTGTFAIAGRTTGARPAARLTVASTP